jgi:hypothetical protein
MGQPEGTARVIRFVLYTDQDFSGDDSQIQFSIFVHSSTTTLLDSALSPMRVKDIPHFDNRIVILKRIQPGFSGDLAIGFRYELENVGVSWHIDTIAASASFKEVDYNFQ